MARKIIVEHYDALDPELLADETVELSLDRRIYKINLATENAERLRHTVGQWSDYAPAAEDQTASGSDAAVI